MQSSLKATPLEMNNNNSVTFEDQQNSKYVITRKGEKALFCREKLLAHLKAHSASLNADYINLEIIVEKVSNGIYSGKFSRLVRADHIPRRAIERNHQPGR